MHSTERVLSLASNTNYINSAIGKHCCVMLNVCSYVILQSNDRLIRRLGIHLSADCSRLINSIFLVVESGAQPGLTCLARVDKGSCSPYNGKQMQSLRELLNLSGSYERLFWETAH
jgi:hypothetical protein